MMQNLNNTRIARTTEAVASAHENFCQAEFGVPNKVEWDRQSVREFGQSMARHGLLIASEIVGKYIDSDGWIRKPDELLTEIYKVMMTVKGE